MPEDQELGDDPILIEEDGNDSQIGSIYVRDLLMQIYHIEKEIPKIDSQKIRESLEQFTKRLREELDKHFGIDTQNHEKRVKLTNALRKLLVEIKKLTAPPQSYGYFARVHEDGMVGVFVKKDDERRVNVSEKVDREDLKVGDRVLLSENYTILKIDKNWAKVGEEAKVSALLGEDIVRVVTHLDEIHDVILAEPLRSQKIREGDILLIFGNFAFNKLPKSREIESLALDVVPDVTYEKIGGLKGQIEKIKDAIELPFIFPEFFECYKFPTPKGVLLYGPPGCGKTLIAKAVANSLAERLKEKHGKKIKGYFISIKGPEILNKYVGESERKIRDIFQKAREKAEENCPVIIFIDEADSVLRTRGQGISSDVEITIVPQFLAELDGMDKLENVIVVLASNRQDLIDPAVLRPGRVNVKVKIDRPDESGAKEIFSIYITPDLPLNAKYFNPADEKYKKFDGDPKIIIQKHIIPEVVKRLWVTEKNPYVYRDNSGNEIKADNRIMKIVTQEEELTLYLKDLASGAMIKSIVDRAKKLAIKREIAGGEKGLLIRDFCMGIELEMQENEELPNTRDDAQRWLDIQGRRERVLNATPFAGKRDKDQKKSETVSTGHYL